MGMSGTLFTARDSFGLGADARRRTGLPVAVTFPSAVRRSPRGNLPFLFPVAGAVGAGSRGKDQTLLYINPKYTEDSPISGPGPGTTTVRLVGA